MAKTPFLLLLVTAAFNLFSQSKIDFNDYKPLECRGDIPEDFRKEINALMNEAGKNADLSRKELAVTKEFTQYSDHNISNFLFSGKMLYGDRISAYVNKVADKVLDKIPELKGEVRFYVIKTTQLNAYSTQRGIIFISMGLLAQIESESQLAFIICHELIHYKNSHNLETFKLRKKLAKDESRSILTYSKENEFEADKEGYQLFLKTDYSTEGLNNLFDVMLYAYLPFDEIAFDSAYFNSGKYVLPSKFFLKEVSGISAEEDVDDSLSTHPNIKRRREAIHEMLEKENKKNGNLFLMDKNEFDTISRLSRHELAISYLIGSEMEEAFYAAYLLEKLYGRNLFSDKIMSSAMYGISKQKLHDQVKDRYSDKKDDDDSYYSKETYWKSVEGESQAIYYFFQKTSAKELSIMTARQMLLRYNEYKEKYFLDRFNSLIHELTEEYNITHKYFYKEAEAADTTVAKEEIEDEPEKKSTRKLSKVSKIKKSRAEKSESSSDEGNFTKFAFYDMYEDTALVQGIKYYIDYEKQKEEEDDDPDYKRYKAAKSILYEKHGKALDIHKLALINPYYNKYFTFFSSYYYSFKKYRYKDPNFTPVEEEKIEKMLIDKVAAIAKDENIEVDILGANANSNLNTEEFNKYQRILNWYNERISLGTMAAFLYEEEEIKDIAAEYGYMGICFVSKVNKNLEVYFALFDLESCGSELVEELSFRHTNPNEIQTDLMLYNIFHQIGQKPEKLKSLRKKYKLDD